MSFLSWLTNIFKKKLSEPPKKTSKSSTTITSQDIKAIAGDNVMATQLDLARAYLEMGKKKLCKQILEHVIKNGNAMQQEEAQNLITKLL